MKKSSLKKQKTDGITLIALVITIIVLLILAGISIASLTGQNGILSKANQAKEQTKKAEYIEELQLIGLGLYPKKQKEGWNTQKYMDEYEIKIPEDQMFTEALEVKQLEFTDEITIQVITKEEYVFWVTEDDVKEKEAKVK